MDLYLNHRKALATGDVLQWRSNSLLGKTIRFFAKNKSKEKRELPWYDVNHTSMVITFDQYDRERRFNTEAEKYGIVPSVLSNQLINYKGTVYWLPLKIEYESIRPTIGFYALGQFGKGYDYLSLFRQSYRRIKIDDKKLFCSEYFAYCIKKTFEKHGLTELNWLEIAPRPCDIPDLDIFLNPIKIK